METDDIVTRCTVITDSAVNAFAFWMIGVVVVVSIVICIWEYRDNKKFKKRLRGAYK